MFLPSNATKLNEPELYLSYKYLLDFRHICSRFWFTINPGSACPCILKIFENIDDYKFCWRGWPSFLLHNFKSFIFGHMCAINTVFFWPSLLIYFRISLSTVGWYRFLLHNTAWKGPPVEWLLGWEYHISLLSFKMYYLFISFWFWESSSGYCHLKIHSLIMLVQSISPSLGSRVLLLSFFAFIFWFI